MRIHKPDDQVSPLELYVAYDYLPAEQYAQTLLTLDRLYETIAATDWDIKYFYHLLRHPYPSPWPHKPWLPLCIDAVETGESISVRFAVKGDSARFVWKGSDLDIILPRSTAPLCVIGAILTGGVWSYEHYLDVELKKAQIENVRAQTEASRSQEKLTDTQIELTRAQTERLLKKHTEFKKPPQAQPSRGVHFEIHTQIQNFYSLMNQPNITKAEINGIDIRGISD